MNKAWNFSNFEIIFHLVTMLSLALLEILSISRYWKLSIGIGMKTKKNWYQYIPTKDENEAEQRELEHIVGATIKSNLWQW